MKRDMLKGLLKQLQDGLHSTEQVDAEMKALLQNLHQDIETVLAKEESPDDPLYVALSDRSRAIYVKFASKHPKLEPALRELGSMLEKMGV
ncbi:DUF4404 family protein [Undibacterium flavidum]|uniref:DUF4404 family protein n=1 Tax=Undibacterium flavidum TaxID=2762297 RepID=A0ABR6YFK8_9BURK|nr:DUF4404 family protein [Undibacterium flavidum]MBC3875350.1 DUF4404 family protein [Undibacterium flavidum]